MRARFNENRPRIAPDTAKCVGNHRFGLLWVVNWRGKLVFMDEPDTYGGAKHVSRVNKAAQPHPSGGELYGLPRAVDPMLLRALQQRQSQSPQRFFEAGTHGQDMGDDDLPPAATPPSMLAAEMMHLEPDEVDFEPTVTSSADTVTYGDGRDSRDWAPGEFGDLNRDVDRERQRYLEGESDYYSDVEFDLDLDIRNRLGNEKRKGFMDLQAQPEEVDLQPPEQASDPIISTGSDERLWYRPQGNSPARRRRQG